MSSPVAPGRSGTTAATRLLEAVAQVLAVSAQMPYRWQNGVAPALRARRGVVSDVNEEGEKMRKTLVSVGIAALVAVSSIGWRRG